jgi:hypothetical protein
MVIAWIINFGSWSFIYYLEFLFHSLLYFLLVSYICPRWGYNTMGKEIRVYYVCSIATQLSEELMYSSSPTAPHKSVFLRQFIIWTMVADARSCRLPVTSWTIAYTGVQSWTRVSTRRCGVMASTIVRLATTKRQNTVHSYCSCLCCTSRWELRVS